LTKTNLNYSRNEIIILFYFIIFILLSCSDIKQENTFEIKKQKPSHKYDYIEIDTSSLHYIETDYAFICSDIYYYDGTRKYPLTNTVSIRNPYLTDSAYIITANYYDSFGNLLQEYLDTSILMSPLESIELVVEEYENQLLWIENS